MLKEWQECALKAKFSQIDLLPRRTRSKTLFGTVVHSALEHYNRTGDVDGALRIFSEDWADIEPDIWDRTNTHEGLRQRGIQIIKDFHAQQRWQPRKVIAVEHRFLVPFGDHELEGTVDLLEVKKNHRGKEILRVVDNKTSSRKPTFAELYLNIQGTVYTWASQQREFWVGNGDGFPPVPNGEWWFEMLQQVPRRFIWYHLWTSTEIDGGERNQTDYDRLYRQCNEIQKAIENEVFIPTISHSTCGFCDYAEGPCPVRVPKKEEIQAQDDAWL